MSDNSEPLDRTDGTPGPEPVGEDLGPFSESRRLGGRVGGKMFISYRRNDSADATGRLHDRLRSHFGETAIFYDVSSIPFGVDFRKYIDDEVSQCDVLLAIIGDSWMGLSNDGQRRLDDPDDLVRIEIEAALTREIPVIPVLVARAAMPKETELPGNLKGLARRNAAAVRSGEDFDAHALRLIHGLERLFKERQQKASDTTDRENEPKPPDRIRQYKISRSLGKGSFGIVYLALDEDLHRLVAIKIPTRTPTLKDDFQAYIREAQAVAKLDHPNIVPVYHVGSDQDVPCYIVSKYIDGCDLNAWQLQSQRTCREILSIIAAIAEALYHAYSSGIIHRDVKPANIMIDRKGVPYLLDFGLALREEEAGRGSRKAGTLLYMSPEQARREGHRVDHRSDIFSLGVVFYELLTGEHPFLGRHAEEVREKIIRAEPLSPRSINDQIPKEVNRICLRALARRPTDRYSNANELADDLRCVISQLNERSDSGVSPSARPPIDSVHSELVDNSYETGPARFGRSTQILLSASSSEDERELIVPKGPRSFDETDSSFFLRLLPGQRDRDGLPDGARFWKRKIESRDPNQAFAVGLVYGPSGCGKSSRVKAALLPRLSDSVIPVYLEASAGETESRLLQELHRKIPDLLKGIDLIAAMTAIRRGKCVPPEKKVTIFLDQFEQWLHSNLGDDNSVLVQALRQCDGVRLQCVIMIRDEFWVAISRFMQFLEIRIVEGENARLIDLLDLRHAKEVLIMFGQAMGTLPLDKEKISEEQGLFLDQAIQGLAQYEKIVPVRLSLFAEMVKDRPWTPETLNAVGGIEGIGTTFLEEEFASRNALPQYRQHQQAAQNVLRSLLPAEGTDIKGHMRSTQELIEISGYQNEPNRFEELIRILDGELRLITPTDPGDRLANALDSNRVGSKCYQLTHDYLVRSLREWLGRKQKENPSGRAELLLEECTLIWDARRENRYLPSLAQWLRILWYVPLRKRALPQRKMLRRATRHHLIRLGSLFLIVVSLVYGIRHYQSEMFSQFQVTRIIDATVAELPEILQDLRTNQTSLTSKLRQALLQAEKTGNSNAELNLRIALLPADSQTHLEFLNTRMLESEPRNLNTLIDVMDPYKDQLKDSLWKIAESEESPSSQHLRAAAALAKYDANSMKWEGISKRTVNELVRENLLNLEVWIKAFEPIKVNLFSSLLKVLRMPLNVAGESENQLIIAERAGQRNLASELLFNYAKDNPKQLTEALLESPDGQFHKFFKAIKTGDSSEDLRKEIELDLSKIVGPGEKERVAKRIANAGAALLMLGRQELVWPQLRSKADSRVRSYLIDRIGRLTSTPVIVYERLSRESDVTIRRALILILGGFEESVLPKVDDANSTVSRESIIPKIRELFDRDPDAGVHSAAEWLLRAWKGDKWIESTQRAFSQDTVEQAAKLAEFTSQHHDRTTLQFFINRQMHTMVLIPGGIKFEMGSPKDEQGHVESENLRMKRIDRSFAISSKLTTVAQFNEFDKSKNNSPLHSNEFLPEEFRKDPNQPVVRETWFQAAEYCNWLSQQEGIPSDQWCYTTDANGRVVGMKSDYLNLIGYRLPTDAEYEYSNRALTNTCRYFGETEDLLGQYAWYQKNSGEIEITHPVGTRKPNDFGLFDMQGNAFSWCNDQDSDVLKSPDDLSIEEPNVSHTQKRVSRGGGYYFMAVSLRAARRHSELPTLQGFYYGFRVAKTVK